MALPETLRFLAAKSSSRSWFLVSDSYAGLNCNVMSIRMIYVCVCVCLSPKLNITKVRLFEVYTKPIECTRVHKTSFSVMSDCLSVVNVDHTDGHYMSHYNPVSYKHVGFPLSMLITLMDITCLIIIPFHINMLILTRGSH